jgi:hypothetical protein
VADGTGASAGAADSDAAQDGRVSADRRAGLDQRQRCIDRWPPANTIVIDGKQVIGEAGGGPMKTPSSTVTLPEQGEGLILQRTDDDAFADSTNAPILVSPISQP